MNHTKYKHLQADAGQFVSAQIQNGVPNISGRRARGLVGLFRILLVGIIVLPLTVTIRAQPSPAASSNNTKVVQPAPVKIASASVSNYLAKFQQGKLTPSQVWNLRTTVECYRKIGIRDSKWDNLAIEAMEAFAVTRGIFPTVELAKLERKVAVCTQQAFRMQCPDLYVHALYMRMAPEYLTNYSKGFAAVSLLQTFNQLKSTQYPAYRKMALLEMALSEMKKERQTLPPMLETAEILARETMEDPEIPEENAYDCANMYFCIGKLYNQDSHPLWVTADALLRKRFPNSYYLHVLKGTAHTQWAWDARGTGWASDISESSWKMMRERIAIARSSLEKAYAMNPQAKQAPMHMLSVLLLEDTNYRELERWFERAMASDTNNVAACLMKVQYLKPQWHGDGKMALDFAKLLLSTTNWGPCVLEAVPSAHFAVAGEYSNNNSDYAKRPDVWPQVSTALTKLTHHFPWISNYREELERWGWMCGKQEEAKKLLMGIDEKWYEH